jgi:NAD(P)H-flavin reductase
VQVSSTGSGSDQPHLLALLRAIRLRLAAPDAVEAGAADTAAALNDPHLSGTGTAASRYSASFGEPPHPDWILHPHWPSATPLAPPAATELPPAAEHRALPAGSEPALPPPALPPSALPPSALPPSALPPSALPPPALPPPALTATDQSGGAHPNRSLPAVASRADVTPFVPADGPDPIVARLSARSGPGAPFGALPGGMRGPEALPQAAGVSPVPGISGIPGGPAMPYVGRPMPGDPVQPTGPTAPPVRPLAAGAPQAPTAGAALPADGMNPADDVALHELQRLLSTSLSMAGGPADVAARLRIAVLQAQPQLLAALPGSPLIQREQLAAALTWLAHNLGDPPVLAAGCAQLGAALAECGVRPQQLQLVGAALAEAMRAGMPGGTLRQDFDLAWRTTWQHAQQWIAHGEAMIAYQPTRWTAVVVSHDLRRPDLAIVRLRPYLPMPFRPGQYARVEVAELPGTWRPYSLAGAPRRDNVVELHVRAKTVTGVSGALVHRTKLGDKVRMARAEGQMGLPERPGRDLLLIAGDTGVAPLKALLTELAATGDPRSAVLFWGARTLDELYDIEEITEIARACKRATVIPVISEGSPGPYASGLVTDAVAAYGEWSDHEVYLAGPPVMIAATGAALRDLGVAPARIHHDLPDG